MSGDSVCKLTNVQSSFLQRRMYTLTYTVNEGDTLEEFGQDNVLTKIFISAVQNTQIR